MKNSEPLYVAVNSTLNNGFQAIVWQTDLGLITTVTGRLDMSDGLIVKDIKTSEIINDIDLRNVLMSILPRK